MYPKCNTYFNNIAEHIGLDDYVHIIDTVSSCITGYKNHESVQNICHHDACNYSTVSILPSMSKLFKRQLKHQINGHFERFLANVLGLTISVNLYMTFFLQSRYVGETELRRSGPEGGVFHLKL